MIRYRIRYRRLYFMIIGILFFLAGCSFVAGDAFQPPLPTIVSRLTLTPTTVVSTATATNTPASAEAQPAGNTPAAAEVVAQSDAIPTPTETSVPTPPSLVPLNEIQLELIPFAAGFAKPVYLTHAGDDSDRVFVVEQAGRILVVQDGQIQPEPFLDIIDLVGSDGNEQGLLSLAFHPNYVSTGQLIVNYTDKQGDTVLASYEVSANPNIADNNSGKVIARIGQPYRNHNGGQVLFGPDGYLYVGMGDGGAANDPQNRGQDLNEVLGKIWRIDLDQGDPYGVPATNPFVDMAQARPEIWSYGWRNPWRISFDEATGDMYVADVGQNQYEEIHVEPAGSGGGLNYGWRIMEGNHCFNPSDCDPVALGLVLPVAEYDHSQGCSVTGGYVYRGQQYPVLQGVYLYGDFCSGNIWGLRRGSNGDWINALLLQSNKSISSFGQDQDGELYLVHHQGEVFRLAGSN